MPNRFKWLVGCLLLLSLGLIWGCDQPDDVFVPASSTELNLQPQRLPTLPDGMVYELWVAESFSNWAVSAVSLGRFGYDFDRRVFLNADGSDRADGGRFLLEEDVLNYEVMLVSVEQTDVPSIGPGPVMLWDTVTTFYENPIKLRFPLSDSLWFNTAMFNLETPSDGNRDENDGSGLWFTSYRERRGVVRDTLALSSWTLVLDTFVGDTTFTTYVESIYNIRTEIVDTVFGFWDTVPRTVVRYDAEVKVATSPPFIYNRTFDLVYTVASDSTITVYGEYLLLDTLFIDYSADFGWRYRGWAVSDAIPENCGAAMNFPGWPVDVGQNSWIPGASSGRLISTGFFDIIDGPDDDNSYSMSDRVPPYPGMDFFNTPCSPAQLVLVDGVSRGSAMITLEPINFDSDANFPLILLAGSLPQYRSQLQYKEGGLVVQNYYMTNWSRSNDPLYGFPSIVVEVTRLSQ
jgi:hypothetical protein